MSAKSWEHGEVMAGYGSGLTTSRHVLSAKSWEHGEVMAALTCAASHSGVTWVRVRVRVGVGLEFGFGSGLGSGLGSR